MQRRGGGDDEEDVELGELENAAFLPRGTAEVERQAAGGGILKWVRGFVAGLSRIRLMLLVLSIFITILVWLGFLNADSVPVAVPPESQALAEELAASLKDTAIPAFVLTYAPLVFLDKKDAFHPSDLAAHIAHTHPEVNFTRVRDVPDPLTLGNLDVLNSVNRSAGEDIYLTSTEDVTQLPRFLRGRKPDAKTLRTEKAVSCAVVVVEKGDGVVDAFYMYFYTFNRGPSVYGHVIGDHLGDWEHNMIRFKDGHPSAVWYSQHEYGAAYTYATVPKIGVRPISFSARGSHANYATAGKHDLHSSSDAIPANLVYDHTSLGPLWDPTLSAYFYTYEVESGKFESVLGETAWLGFEGRWGDAEYADEKVGQETWQGFHRWTAGPQGPAFKGLGRDQVCLPGRQECVVREVI